MGEGTPTSLWERRQENERRAYLIAAYRAGGSDGEQFYSSEDVRKSVGLLPDEETALLAIVEDQRHWVESANYPQARLTDEGISEARLLMTNAAILPKSNAEAPPITTGQYRVLDALHVLGPRGQPIQYADIVRTIASQRTWPLVPDEMIEIVKATVGSLAATPYEYAQNGESPELCRITAKGTGRIILSDKEQEDDRKRMLPDYSGRPYYATPVVSLESEGKPPWSEMNLSEKEFEFLNWAYERAGKADSPFNWKTVAQELGIADRLAERIVRALKERPNSILSFTFDPPTAILTSHGLLIAEEVSSIRLAYQIRTRTEVNWDFNNVLPTAPDASEAESDDQSVQRAEAEAKRAIAECDRELLSLIAKQEAADGQINADSQIQRLDAEARRIEEHYGQLLKPLEARWGRLDADELKHAVILQNTRHNKLDDVRRQRRNRIEKRFGIPNLDDAIDRRSRFVGWIKNRTVVFLTMAGGTDDALNKAICQKAVGQAFEKAVEFAGAASLSAPPKPPPDITSRTDAEHYILSLREWAKPARDGGLLHKLGEIVSWLNALHGLIKTAAAVISALAVLILLVKHFGKPDGIIEHPTTNASRVASP